MKILNAENIFTSIVVPGLIVDNCGQQLAAVALDRTCVSDDETHVVI